MTRILTHEETCRLLIPYCTDFRMIGSDTCEVVFKDGERLTIDNWECCDKLAKLESLTDSERVIICSTMAELVGRENQSEAGELSMGYALTACIDLLRTSSEAALRNRMNRYADSLQLIYDRVLKPTSTPIYEVCRAAIEHSHCWCHHTPLCESYLYWQHNEYWTALIATTCERCNRTPIVLNKGAE